MALRKIIFWMHLSAGLVAGTVVLVMSFTGILLAFERQLTDWADRDLRISPPGVTRLPLDQLISKVRELGTPTGLSVRSDPAAPVGINLGRERTIFVNPYTGAVLGEGSKSARDFFRVTTNVHRWLGAPQGNRELGRAITGACNVAFLFLVTSGLCLWWPRRGFRAIFLPKRGLTGKVRNFNWHNAVGFWSAPFLFLIVLSGILLSYSWATDLLYRLTKSEPPAARTAPARRPGGGETPVIPSNLDRFSTIAAKTIPDWRTISVRFENSPAAPVTLTIEQGVRGRPDLRTQLTLNSETGEIVRAESFASYNLGRRLRTWARFVHTGEAGGIPGQIIGALVCAGACLLVYTGFALAWRRFRKPAIA